MPRRQFVADLEALCTSNSNFRRGDDDGSFVYLFSGADFGIRDVELAGYVPELSEYPSAHQTFLYATGDAPQNVTRELESVSVLGMTLKETIATVEKKLRDSLKGAQDGEGEMVYEEEELVYEEASDGYDSDEVSDAGWDDDDHHPSVPNTTSDYRISSDKRVQMRRALRRDLIAAKKAGYRVGLVDSWDGGSDLYVSLSIRIAKLELSEQALSAWGLDKSRYLVLLIHFTRGYEALEELAKGDGNYHTQKALGFYVGTHTRYKPTIQQARRAMCKQYKPEIKGQDQDSEEDGEMREDAFESIFISGPLNELMNQRLTILLKCRANTGFSWDGAELFYDEVQGADHARPEPRDEHYVARPPRNAVANIVAADGIADNKNGTPSLPLLAIQFALRHLVRCTEFCLVCHNRLEVDFEALKPYVCSKPLCLYQYMALGLGPRIEHEIKTAPIVVDLLISFCYAAARSSRLKDYPDGMNLVVPSMKEYEANYNRKTYELEYSAIDAHRPPVKPGDWIRVLANEPHYPEWHARVLETLYWPKIKLAAPVRTSYSNDPDNLQFEGEGLGGDTDLVSITFKIYNDNFDELESDHEKRHTIATLLDTLPRVHDMRNWLSKNCEGTELNHWQNRISPSALGVLRWIIASNRSCILAVENDDEKVRGLNTWLQFRFAMGAPDKEQRFLKSVKDARQRLNLKYPSMFAWHGSPLGNWHGIIREGLHFKETLHGRAYGNGCYHSLHLETSKGYAHSPGFGHATASSVPMMWEHSELAISSAISLNEIVNVPAEFVSRTPHLVIAQLDWIQTRYLFVQDQRLIAGAATQPVLPALPSSANIIPQDPAFTPSGETGRIIIPAAPDVKLRQAPPINSKHNRSTDQLIDLDGDLIMTDSPPKPTRAEKKRKVTLKGRVSALFFNAGSNNTQPEVVDLTGDSSSSESDSTPGDPSSDSDCSAQSDIEFLAPTPRPASPVVAPPNPHAFVPESLDFSTIPLLPPPDYATNGATRRLSSEIATILKLQNTTPLAELGFYLSPNRIENMYQWIVELHSFPENLALVKDMRAANPPIKSIVLEIRFGPQYPISPPFVRVVSPRFLEFARGGGGNVTAGGALCMELLTNTGWSAVMSVEAVLLQVRLAICDEERPARLGAGGIYGAAEAREAFERACRAHGWAVPADFRAMI